MRAIVVQSLCINITNAVEMYSYDPNSATEAERDGTGRSYGGTLKCVGLIFRFESSYEHSDIETPPVYPFEYFREWFRSNTLLFE